MMCSFATLEEKSLDVVRAVEKETGRTLLAYDCFVPDTIGAEEIEKIQAAEKELCRTLIAVKTEHSA